MMPPTHFAAPQANVPAEPQSPPLFGRDTLSQACARALSEPVLVTDIGDGALLVEPLHFHRVYRAADGVKVSRVHAKTNTPGAQHDPE